MRYCPKCEAHKDEDEFYRRKRGGYSGWCKKCLCSFQTARWLSRKIVAVKLFGGACTKCGYGKNLACLDFHHVDPQQKELIWRQMSKRPWDKVLEELRKCTLLCKNCHGELHNPTLSMDCLGAANANNRLDQDRTSEFTRLARSGACPVCNADVFGTKYCSGDCAHQAQRRVERPGKEQLQHDMSVLSWSAMGTKYGVSDNAVRKWARRYGLLT